MTARILLILEKTRGHRPRLQKPGLSLDHSRRNGVIIFINDDEPAGLPILAVWIANDRLKRFNSHLPDIVRLQLRYRRLAIERIHIQPVIDFVDDCANALRRMPEYIAMIQTQFALIHPAERGFEIGSR